MTKSIGVGCESTGSEDPDGVELTPPRNHPFLRAMRGVLYYLVRIPAVLAITLAVLPRALFQSAVTSSLVEYVINTWPKMASDAHVLAAVNSTFVPKYVVSVTALMTLGFLGWMAGTALLFYVAVSRGAVFGDRPPALGPCKRYGPLTVMIGAFSYAALFFPTPFRTDSAGVVRIPANELCLFYWFMISTGMFLFLMIASYVLLAICFPERRKNG